MRPRWLHTFIDWFRYGKRCPSVHHWQRERYPKYIDIGEFTYKPGPPVHFSPGIWSIMYLKAHPELKSQEEIPTVPVSREQTEKYKALPKWLK